MTHSRIFGIGKALKPKRLVVSASEAAQLLGVHRDTVVRYAKQGIIKGFKAGGGETGHWKFPMAAIEAFASGESIKGDSQWPNGERDTQPPGQTQ